MRTRALLALALLAAVGPAAAFADDLEDGVRAYLHEEDAKKRATTWATRLASHDGMDPAEIAAVVTKAFPVAAKKEGFTHGVKFRSHGEEWTYSVRLPPAVSKGGLLPLVVDPGHGSFADSKEKDVEQAMQNWLGVAGAGDEAIYVRTRVLDRLTKDKRYDEWSTPRRAAGKENLDTIAAIVLDAVRDASLRYPVDPDRVHVEGLSQTGFWAWWLGAFAPDRFATVAPMSAVTWQVRKLLPSLRTLPVFVLHGTADAICPFAQAKSTVEELKRIGGDVTFLAEEGGEHVARTWLRWGEAWPAMAAKRRDPAPKTVERVLVGGERPWVAWISAEGFARGEFNPFAPTMRLAGKIEGQEVSVEAEGVEAVTVHLGAGLVDLGKPVKVTVNGKAKFEGVPKTSLRDALETAFLRGDPRAAWPARIRIALR